MFGLLHPALLLLLVPALWCCWRFRDGTTATTVVRVVALVLLALALAGLYRDSDSKGRDVIFVVDRSRSMPADGDALALEQIRLAEDARAAGDRVGVVSFGRAPALERLPSESARFGGFARALDREGSDVGAAIDLALEAIPRERPAAIEVLSDGEATGAATLPAARRALARGIPVHTRTVRRAGSDKAGLYDLELPPEVARNEPFQLTAWAWADEPCEAEIALEREGRVLATRKLVLEPGANRVLFRDIATALGAAEYRAVLRVEGDALPDNNAVVAGTLARGAPIALVVNHDGRPDLLSTALARSGIDVRVTTPEEAPATRLAWSSVRAVVLENVAADRFGRKLDIVRELVEEHGAGLLMTGGKASFALGGYYLSPLDRLLPVSMEMRNEWRKLGIGIAFALDRSGSMAVEVAPGVPKMDLANQGTIAAIELLGPLDDCAVIAVDSAAHTIVELTTVDDAEALCHEVSGIESMGGGIYVRTALEACVDQLENSDAQNRHIVLFCDANDSEEQDGVVARCKELLEIGIRTSVIALGTEADSDSQFLKDTAAAGEGTCTFCSDPSDLPRVFAQDTMKLARSTFVDADTTATANATLLGLGDWMPTTAAPLAGYNLTWLRPKASAGLVTVDENAAPAVAWRHLGAGRSAAITAQIGGEFGREFASWDGFAPLSVSLARWLCGRDELPGTYVSARREAGEALVQLELDPTVAGAPDPAGLRVRLRSPSGRLVAETPLDRTGETSFVTRVPLGEQGVHVGEVVFGDGQVVPLPPVSLPYSPELERIGDSQRGLRLMERVARESGGETNPIAADLFAGERIGRAWSPLGSWLALAALCVVLIEIAFRRLQLWGWLAAFAARPMRALRRERAVDAIPEPAATVTAGPTPVAAAARSREAPAAAPEPPAQSPVTGDLSDALAQARARAQRGQKR
ncbi:MAG: VWA domain-containing protein [Planctomycetota bacterium]|nr:MAG: VWA domain-containing protein [Planctomycetota bacterium]